MTFDPSGQLLELYIDDRLDQAETLNLTIPADAAKADLLVVDGELEVDGRAFYIAELEQRRQGAATVITVEAEALWYRLGDLIWPGAFTITDVTPSAGLATILAGTGWTVADYSTSEATTYTLEAEDVTRLELLRTWADITGKHLRFDTIAREVRLADVAGADLGLAFRYRRNVLNIRRRIRPPACTVLYPYGLDDLSIAGLNGTAYVEDFSYYTAQGLDLATARERFTRSRIWSDTAYTTDTALLAAANTRLAELAAPIITYELDVVDLTELTDADDTVHVGDTCRVADPAFDLDVRTTVVRVQRFPTQPWRNRVELAVLAGQLASRTSAAGRSSSSEAWAQFVGRVTADYQVRNDGTYILARVPLRFRAAGGAAHYWVDLDLVGVGAGVATVWLYDAETDETIRTYDVDYADGITSRVTFDLARFDLTGAVDYRLRITTAGDGGPSPANGVDVAADVDGEARFHIHALGAVRETPTSPNSETFEYTGAVQTFTVPDNVTEVTITAKGARGGDSSSIGGPGGQLAATFPGLTPGTVFDVYVGGAPGVSPLTDGTAGWPNGGEPGAHGGAGSSGGGGGGATFITPTGDTIAGSLLVAAGGGGAGYIPGAYTATGGAGGLYAGVDGLDGYPNTGGGGATQFAGGSAGASGGGSGSASAGTFGHGGASQAGSGSLGDSGGAGGGGWYGGGGGGGTGTVLGDGNGGGGGGSGYIAGTGFDITISDGSNTDHGQMIVAWETPDL